MKPTVENYEIVDKLGQGGMGVVYKARDLRLGRTVALKFLPAEVAGSDHKRRRFIREATAASSIDHPNVCTIFDIGENAEGLLYIAMAFYEGRTLRETNQGGKVSIDRAVDIAIQIAEGLSRAHQKGVVHRDIKPANLMITGDGIVKILDFGLASTTEVSDLTADGLVLGTFGYMSPQQFVGDKVDHRTDIWSLGVVLYEMLAGCRPYDSVPRVAFESRPSQIPEPVRRLRSEVPSALADIVGRALSADLVHRYQTIDTMLADLRQCRRPTSSDGPLDPTVSLQSDVRASDSGGAHSVEVPSVAVLPFENLSGDEENAYFSDGLTDDLIHTLATHENLRVISRTSVYELKKSEMRLAQIADVLGVDTVLEGSVRKAGNQVRIVARLINPRDDKPLWSERYDRELQDVFAVQDEIAQMIANRLQVELISQGGSKRSPVHHGSFEAYELYMKGRHFWNRRIFAKALECFEAALELDPEFALAHVGLANYHTTLGVYGGVDPRTAWPIVRKAVLRALELDRNLPEAHIALAYVRTFEDWDWASAHRELRTALDLAPGLVDSHIAYAMHGMQMGRFESAKRHTDKARRLDPLSALVNTFDVSRLVYERKFDEAVKVGDKGLETAPDAFDLRLFYSMALRELGRFDEALEQLTLVHDASGGSPLVKGFMGACHAAAGRDDEARAILRQLDEAPEGAYVPPTARAFILGALGEIDDAIGALEDAAEVRDGMLCYSAVMPGFDPLRGDSRFDGLLERMGLSVKG